MRKRIVSALMACAMSASRCFADAPATQPDDTAKINSIIADMGSPDAKKRQRAEWNVEDEGIDFNLIKAQLDRKDLTDDVHSRLEKLLNHVGPWIQARQRRSAAEAKENADSMQTVMGWYRAGHHTDPKWDELAKTAMTDYLSRSDGTKTFPEIQKELETAISAGCEDPLVRFYYARIMSMNDADAKAIFDQFQKAIDGLESSTNSPAIMRSLCHVKCIIARMNSAADKTDRQVVIANREDMRVATDEYVQNLAGCGLSAKEATSFGEGLMEAAELMGGTQIDMFNTISPALESAYPKATEPLVLKAKMYVNWAWQARGSGWANTVTPQGWTDMADRLTIANQAIAKSYANDPNDAEGPTQMLSVELGQGKGRPIMEMWYTRAMTANPDGYEACSKKLYYLEPKWYGTPQEMIDFGRQCVKDGNWWGHIPFVLVDAHQEVAEMVPNSSMYYQQAAVWMDVQSVYQPFLERYPEADWAKTAYVKWACRCNQWKTAVMLFDELGDRANVNEFNGKATYDYWRRKAIAKVKAQLQVQPPN